MSLSQKNNSKPNFQWIDANSIPNKKDTDSIIFTDNNVSRSIHDTLTCQELLSIESGFSKFARYKLFNAKELLWDNYVKWRIFFIRHWITELEWSLQRDDEPILDKNYWIIDNLIRQFQHSWLWNNLYLYSNNRTLRVEQTVQYFLKKLYIKQYQTNVVNLDTTEKEFDKEIRTSITKTFSSVFVSQLIKLCKWKENYSIFCIIHSSNQSSIESHFQINPFIWSKKLSNLWVLQMDIWNSWVIDYGLMPNIFKLDYNNIKLVLSKLKKCYKKSPPLIKKDIKELIFRTINNSWNTYINQTMIGTIYSLCAEHTSFIKLIKVLSSTKISIRNKQNYFNSFLLTNKGFLKLIFDRWFFMDLDFVIFSLSSNLESNPKYFLKKSLSVKLGCNDKTKSFTYKVLLLLKNNNNYKWIKFFLNELYDNNYDLFNKMKEFYESHDERIFKIFKSIGISKTIKKYTLASIISLWISSGLYKIQFDYWKNFFIDSTKYDEELKINKLNFMYIDKSNKYHLDLSHIKTIDIDQLYYLMQLNLYSLDLSWIEKLDDKSTIELSKFKWNVLNLNWLNNIDSYQFDNISKFCNNWKWRLYIDWLRTVDLLTMDKILKFQWENLSLNWLIFEWNESNSLYIARNFSDRLFRIQLDKYSFSKQFLESYIQIINNKSIHSFIPTSWWNKTVYEFKKEIDSKLSSLLSEFHLNQNFIQQIDKKELIKSLAIPNYPNDQLLDYYILNNSLIKSIFYDYIKLYLKDFFNNNKWILYSYFNENTYEDNNTINKFFEKEFLLYLSKHISETEFNLLSFNYNKLNDSIASAFTYFDTENQLKQEIKSFKFKLFTSKIGWSRVPYELDSINIDVSVNNDKELSNILDLLDKDKKYNLIIRNSKNLSSISSQFDKLSIDVLVAFIDNIDKLPNFKNVKSIFINPPHFEYNIESIEKLKQWFYDYVVYYPIKQLFELPDIINSHYKYLRNISNTSKWLLIDCISNNSKFHLWMKDNEILRLSNLKVNNLHLWRYLFDKAKAEYFARKFVDSSNSKVEKLLMIPNNNEMLNKLKKLTLKFPMFEDEINSQIRTNLTLKNKELLISYLLINWFVEIYNINIFKDITVWESTVNYCFNKSLIFSWLEQINLSAFTAFKNNWINCFYLTNSNLNDDNIYYINYDLIIDSNYEPSQLVKDLIDFITWFKLSWLVIPSHSKAFFNPIFKWEKIEQVINILENENLLISDYWK